MDLAGPSLTLPEDPKDSVFLKICFVCQAPSKPGFNHLRNYGAIVCFSCRAFWRRCYQNTTVSPKFVCRSKAKGFSSSDCFIKATTRRNCKKCRHDRCLRAGMNAAAVLSDDQKKERFKKLHKKRQKMLDREAKLKKMSKKTRASASSANNVSGSGPSNAKPQAFPSTRLRGRSNKTPEEISPPTKVTLDEVEKEFRVTRDKIRCQRFLAIEEDLCSMQSLGIKELTLVKGDIVFFMDRLSEEFKLFASSHRMFKSESKHEALKALETTTPLYVQLCMARYLMVNKVLEMQDAKQFTKKSWMTSFMQKQFLEEFFKKTNIFRPTADLDLYAKLIVKLKGLPELSSSTKFAVIAYSLIDTTIHPEVVEMYNKQFRSTEEFLDHASLVGVLKSMALFFSENSF